MQLTVVQNQLLKIEIDPREVINKLIDQMNVLEIADLTREEKVYYQSLQNIKQYLLTHNEKT